MELQEIAREEVFELYRSENARLDPQLLREVFDRTTDKELATFYGLKILRPGIFYR